MWSVLAVLDVIEKSDQSVGDTGVVQELDHAMQVLGVGDQELEQGVALETDQGVEHLGQVVQAVLVYMLLLYL